jgi:hypothetical protein
MMQRATGLDHREEGVTIVDPQLSEPHSIASLEDLVGGAGGARHSGIVASASSEESAGFEHRTKR